VAGVSARRLFGTDGVRGVAGSEITAALALALGRAAVLQSGIDSPRVLVIRDTRESGEMLEAAIAAGLASAGAEVLLGGVLPTPAASLLIGRHGLDLGVVLSASHNVYSDNGIKLFGADGFKLADEREQQIEEHLEEQGEGEARVGRIRELHGAREDYVHDLHHRFQSLSLDGLAVLLDCANGATYRVAPAIFERLGARVSTLAVEPDGRNINAGCGSTHIETLARAVTAGGHDIGFAFDGDGDRVLAVDRDGQLVDGDELLTLVALHLLERDRLPGNGIAVTVMTNFAIVAALEQAGIQVASTAVGDRYVLEALRERGWALGGGDLSQRRRVEKLPQRLVNVRVRGRSPLDEAAALQAAIAREAQALAGRGRVLVRPSGTEPLIRVMVEAPTAEEAEAVCARLVAVVESELG
jgi:phosphoglucosamine mutase